MKVSSMYHRLLIYDVKSTTKIEGMGPFNKKLIFLLADSDIILLLSDSLPFFYARRMENKKPF